MQQLHEAGVGHEQSDDSKSDTSRDKNIVQEVVDESKEEHFEDSEGEIPTDRSVSLTHREGNELAVSTMRKLRQIGRENSILETISREDIRLVYTFTKRLGSGSYGVVRVAYKTVNPGKNFAIKSIKRDSIIGDEEDDL